jgi:hypothetical protein
MFDKIEQKVTHEKQELIKHHGFITVTDKSTGTKLLVAIHKISGSYLSTYNPANTFFLTVGNKDIETKENADEILALIEKSWKQ